MYGLHGFQCLYAPFAVLQCLHGLRCLFGLRCLHGLQGLHGLRCLLGLRCLHGLQCLNGLQCLHGLQCLNGLQCLHGLQCLYVWFVPYVSAQFLLLRNSSNCAVKSHMPFLTNKITVLKSTAGLLKSTAPHVHRCG